MLAVVFEFCPVMLVISLVTNSSWNHSKMLFEVEGTVTELWMIEEDLLLADALSSTSTRDLAISAA